MDCLLENLYSFKIIWSKAMALFDKDGFMNSIQLLVFGDITSNEIHEMSIPCASKELLALWDRSEMLGTSGVMSETNSQTSNKF